MNTQVLVYLQGEIFTTGVLYTMPTENCWLYVATTIVHIKKAVSKKSRSRIMVSPFQQMDTFKRPATPDIQTTDQKNETIMSNLEL